MSLIGATSLYLSLLSSGVHAQGAEVGPCPFNTTPAFYATDSKECRALLELNALVERLTAAADFKKGEIPLSREVEIRMDEPYNAGFGYPTPEYPSEKKEIVVSDGFVRCHGEHPESAADVLAHEIGHAVQLREGVHREIAQAQREVGNPYAFLPRREAQADELAAEILRRAGIPPRLSRAVDIGADCVGAKPHYRPNGTHPTFPARWVDDILMKERFKNEEAQRSESARQRSARVQELLAHGAPWASSTLSEAPDSKPSWREILRRHDWRSISDDGRRDGAVRGVIRTDVPQPFTADRQGRVRLPGGKLWWLPPDVWRSMSPAEIIAFATRGNVPPETIQEGFKRGLEYLIRTQDWSKLPGKITDE